MNLKSIEASPTTFTATYYTTEILQGGQTIVTGTASVSRSRTTSEGIALWLDAGLALADSLAAHDDRINELERFTLVGNQFAAYYNRYHLLQNGSRILADRFMVQTVAPQEWIDGAAQLCVAIEDSIAAAKVASIVAAEEAETARLAEEARWAALTPEEQAAEIAANAVPPSPEEIWQNKLAEGYLDVPSGIKLKTTMDAQSLFTSMVALVKEGLDMSALTNDTNVSIWDYNGVEQSMTVLAMRQLLFRYGLYCKSIFDAFKP